MAQQKEEEANVVVPSITTLARDIDFTDPFQCEVEISRLLSENERLFCVVKRGVSYGS